MLVRTVVLVAAAAGGYVVGVVFLKVVALAVMLLVGIKEVVFEII